MKRKRLCDMVCRMFWIHCRMPELTVEQLRAYGHYLPAWFTLDQLLASVQPLPPAAIMSALSRTPGPLILDHVSLPNIKQAIRIRPPWPTIDRNAIVEPGNAIKSEADFRILNERRGALIGRKINDANLAEWETRQLAWLESACEAWIEKTCPRRYREVEVAV